jgi:outer membrane autotransporter protein
VNSYTEKNSDASLAVGEDQSDSFRSRLGGEVRLPFHYAGIGYTPHLEATWLHEFMDSSRGVTSQFTQFGGGSFTVTTPKASRDSALIDFGVDAQVNNELLVFADYVVETGNNAYFGQSVQAGVKVNF